MAGLRGFAAALVTCAVVGVSACGANDDDDDDSGGDSGESGEGGAGSGGSAGKSGGGKGGKGGSSTSGKAGAAASGGSAAVENSGGEAGEAPSATGGSSATGGDAEPGDPCAVTADCVVGAVCFNGYCVGAGVLRVSLSFTGDTDADLHLITADGNEISFSNRSSDGGTLDVDQCISSCGTQPHAENIVFLTPPSAGTYGVFVVNFDGRAATSFRIQVAGAVTAEFEGELSMNATETSETFEFDYDG